jgi:hypothetical protein
MNSVERAITKLTDDSDIEYRSTVYEAISQFLTQLGLNLAFFTFTTRTRSSCARKLTTGEHIRCPVLTIYLKYKADFRQTGIDPKDGNWSDKWKHTRVVVNAINDILGRHGYGDEYVSDHTFAFVRSREELAFREIGRECKTAVKELISAEAPGVQISHIFWSGIRYDVVMQNTADYKRVRRQMKTRIEHALPRLFAEVDGNGYCQSYNAKIVFGHVGMNLFHLMREDY